MKFTIDTERKEITLLEPVKLGELQKVLFNTVLNWEEYIMVHDYEESEEEYWTRFITSGGVFTVNL